MSTEVREDKYKAVRPRRCDYCRRPTLTEFCSSGCAVAAMTESKINYFFPPAAHEEIRASLKDLERLD